ncbi:YggN family protein [Alteromonas pelagimontana]|uniref:YggN family protein n=1 Tax=Alteromonas pelagimontana TaxID=1858656 RepID=A0A6M4MET0_9ALTE|nr:DUF2884 family protein [Alteromonas pelagimontana]QJR81599.1 YggN family protein [Alteromonas pelagimontana]
MKKLTLITAAIGSALFVSSAYADVNIDSDCEIDLHGDMQYYKGLLTVKLENGSTMTIKPNHELAINGSAVSLDDEQQQWVEDYYRHIDTSIPMTLNIAKEGLELASVAVGEVFGELLGHDDEMVMEFQQTFDSMSAEMQSHFYDENGNIRVDSSQFSDDGWFDSAWEDRFESQMEKMMSQSMGKLLIAIGTEMIWDGGDMSAFEERMEKFGESIEERVEGQAEALEVKADALCEALSKADHAENRMRQNISGLEGLNLLEINRDNMQM